MNWMKFKWLYFLISGLVIIPGIYSLFKFGLKPSIDFTGGAIIELRFDKDIKKLGYEDIKDEIKKSGLSDFSVQTSGEKTILIRSKLVSKEEAAKVEQALSDKFSEKPQEIRFETVGPTLGKELLKKTIIAIILAAGFIMLYVGRQFKNFKFGICAILAMFHDTLVLLGSFSLLGHFLGVEVDTLFVTAMLTILSFSVHDTVVVYDRIRESQKLFPNTSWENLVNKAITETISRSLNNSLTIIFMLIALCLLGGATIRWFTIALLIGTVSGTYSSTFTAAPLLVVWSKLEERRKRK
jgi:preprotein translocase subunit SecF